MCAKTAEMLEKLLQQVAVESAKREEEFQRRELEYKEQRNREINEMEERHKEVLQRLQAYHKDMLAAVTAQRQQYDTSGAAGSTRPTFSIPPNKPQRLDVDFDLKTFRGWELSWTDYAVVTRLSELSNNEQISHLKSFFTPRLVDTLEHVINAHYPSDQAVTVAEILKRIKKYLRDQRNVALDRVEFEERRQREGETFDSFYMDLSKIADNADLCQLCRDVRLTTRIISGISCKQTRTELLQKSPFPTLTQAVDLCRGLEAANINERALSRTSLQDTRPRVEKATTRDTGDTFRVGEDRCKECGFRHGQAMSCPAKGSTCFSCGRIGHFSRMCRFGKSKGSKSCVIKCHSLQNRVGQAPPLIWVSIYDDQNHCLGERKVLPDTGAAISIASEAWINQLGITRGNYSKPACTEVLAANQSMECIGTVTLTIKFGGHSTKMQVLVCRQCEGAMLAWYVFKDLGIIPKDYPNVTPAIKQVLRTQHQMDLQNFLDSGGSNPNDDDIMKIKNQLVHQFADVFCTDIKLPPMVGEDFQIQLSADAEAYAVHGARPVPFARREEAKRLNEEMQEKGIIAPVSKPTEWCHPMVLVPKPNGGLRLCVDLTKLNKSVKRPGYPTTTPKDAVSMIPNTRKFMSTFDATHGYWQLTLHKDSQALTTFMTPWGRFQFLRAPMGLVSTGDEYCRRRDEALRDVPNIVKVVDDILVYSGDFKTHVKQVWNFLERFRAHRITLNPQKMTFCQSEVKYVGYVITSDGIAADPNKIKAITDFPQPFNITQLQSFMGMVNQLGDFSTEISDVAEPLRCLLKKKNAFVWTDVQEQAFRDTKRALTKTPVLATFDPSLSTVLQSDASRRKGLGYALLQLHSVNWRLIQCGSRFLSDTESRYAMVELELLAAVWAMQKCKLFLTGLRHFKLIVDHQPLISILNKQTLDMVENPRLQRLKKKGIYVFTAEWRKGKNHAIPDALSRAPVDDPTKEDEVAVAADAACMNEVISIKSIQFGKPDGEDFPVNAAEQEDLLLTPIRECASTDDSYRTSLQTIQSGFPMKCELAPTAVQPYWKIRNDLSVDNGLALYNARIVVPKSYRGKVLARLHDAHQGITRMKRRARQILYWPAITIDIENKVQSCNKCQEYLPSLPKEPMLTDPMPSRIFQDVATDLFSHNGKSYLVYTDRLSRWPIITQWEADPSSRQVIRAIRRNFSDTGVPTILRSDGGPQFSSDEFKTFVERWGVVHSKSSPYYSQSNGLAEAAVKAMKHLLVKTSPNGDIHCDDFQRGILEWRNTLRVDGRSPAQVVFGQSLRTCVPAHHTSFHENGMTWQRNVICEPHVQGRIT